MDRNVNFKANSRYIRKKSQSSADVFLKLLIYMYRASEKLLCSDGFAAGFCGVSLLLIMGIVGGIEIGTLSIKSGVIFSLVLLSAVGVVVYKKNRE